MSVPQSKRQQPTQFNVVTKAQDVFTYTRGLIKNKKHFPKKERFLIAKDIYELSRDVVFCLMDANELKLNVEWERELRLKRQRDAIMAARKLTYLIRQSRTERYISTGTYEYWVKMIDQLITLIIAWEKSDFKRI